MLNQGNTNTKAIHSSKHWMSHHSLLLHQGSDQVARSEVGFANWFPLETPAPRERIRPACSHEFTASLRFCLNSKA